MKKIKKILSSITTIDMIFIVVIVQFIFTMNMENIKMNMVKEYVPTETRVDSVLITDIRKIRNELDSLRKEIKNDKR